MTKYKDLPEERKAEIRRYQREYRKANPERVQRWTRNHWANKLAPTATGDNIIIVANPGANLAGLVERLKVEGYAVELRHPAAVMTKGGGNNV